MIRKEYLLSEVRKLRDRVEDIENENIELKKIAEQSHDAMFLRPHHVSDSLCGYSKDALYHRSDYGIKELCGLALLVRGMNGLMKYLKLKTKIAPAKEVEETLVVVPVKKKARK